MGDIYKNRTDITMPTMARFPEREEIADPTVPTQWISILILAGRTAARSTNIWGYVLAFDVQVWMLLLCSVVVLPPVAALLHFYACKMRRQRASFFGLAVTYFWQFFENMFCEASACPPSETSVRVVSSVWWIAVMLLLNAFASLMSACLMVKSEQDRIRTIEDVANRPYLIPYVAGDTGASRLIQTMNAPAYRKVWSMIRRHQSDIKNFYAFPEKMLLEVAQGKAVIIHAGILSKHQVTTFCKNKRLGEYYFADDFVVNTWPFGVYLNRNLPKKLRKTIKDFVVRYIESGLNDFQLRSNQPPLETCLPPEPEKALRFTDMVSIFYIWIACCGLSTLAFVLELLIAKVLAGTGQRGRYRGMKF
ncbi:glutamate receptor 1-like [Ornithodoros turicata]|uniref:glutamate receptor 1-like n=1 Tax=Ornithodoros turicata TaxID=34597 RepID=UPI00313A2CB9